MPLPPPVNPDPADDPASDDVGDNLGAGTRTSANGSAGANCSNAVMGNVVAEVNTAATGNFTGAGNVVGAGNVTGAGDAAVGGNIVGEAAAVRRAARHTRLFAALRLLLFAVVIGAAAVWLHRHSGGDPKAWLQTLRSANPWVFIALMALLPAIGFPIAACYLFAGAAFGFLYGWLYCLLGLGAGMSLGYIAARTFLRHPLETLLATWARRIPALDSRHHLRAVLLLRLVPGPSYAIQNALLALLNIPFPTYLAASLLAQGLIAALMCALGASARQPVAVTVALVLAAVAGLSLAAHFGIRRNWRRRSSTPPASAQS